MRTWVAQLTLRPSDVQGILVEICGEFVGWSHPAKLEKAFELHLNLMETGSMLPDLDLARIQAD